MHLERINPLAPERETNQRRTGERVRSSRRGFLLGAAALVGSLTLAGCSSGSSRDAQRGKEQDATRESVVKDLQATETWNVVNATPTPGTPEPDE